MNVYVGVGARRGVGADEVLALIARTVREADKAAAVVALATVDAKADEPGIVAAARHLGVPLLTYPATALAARPGPGRPSPAALAAVGVPGVAEAAALTAAGEGAVLLVGKRISPRATCAVARR
ncbi:cobalamin biosynthesis protein [Streptomyces sp. NPDC049555]|uniref:cobalamin biosynthesis protein n=1 Tax=Streptomyces sp. NPDC049555 TaxID=3154930 RepID=UPI003420C2A0